MSEELKNSLCVAVDNEKKLIVIEGYTPNLSFVIRMNSKDMKAFLYSGICALGDLDLPPGVLND